MKVLEFETSKGKFVLIDKNNDWCFGEKFNYYGENNFDALNIVNVNESFSYSKSFKISEITEEQASEIVQIDEHFHGKDYYKNYINNNKNFLNPIESLHSLLKSKGIHLFKNPNNTPYFTNRSIEQKTFYNPYIFKL